MEYAELEGSQKDCQVQCLALHRTSQESHHVLPETIAQTSIEFS